MAPASQRRFFFSPHAEKTPARRQRHEKPAFVGASDVSHFTDPVRREKFGLDSSGLEKLSHAAKFLIAAVEEFGDREP